MNMRISFEALPALSAALAVPNLDYTIAQFGGTATGMAILHGITQKSRVLATPPVVLIRPEVNSRKPGQNPELTAAPLSDYSWAIKFSGMRESFSEHCRRGQHSSDGRRIEKGMSADTIAQRIQAAWAVRPQGTILIALQRFLDLSVPHTPVDINIQDGLAWLEFIQETNRLLVVHDLNGRLLYREAAGPVPVEISDEDVDLVSECALAVYSSAGGVIPRLNVEAIFFARSRHLELLQLRPTPPDRPFDNLGLSTFAGERQADPIWSTRFVRGAFRISIENSVVTSSSSPAIIRGADRSDAETERMFGGIDEAGLCLIDTVTGFRMTHERWNLPPIGKRRNYKFLYLPRPVLDRSWERCLQIHSNGDIAIGWLE